MDSLKDHLVDAKIFEEEFGEDEISVELYEAN